MVFEKKKLHKIYKTTGFRNDYIKFADCRNRCKTLANECYKKYVEDTENNVTHNIKSFWQFVNSKRHDSGLPANIFLDNVEADNGQDIADCFAKYFSETYNETEVPLNNEMPCDTTVNICTTEFNEQKVYDKLKKLDVNKGAGPDGLPPRFYKWCSESLTQPLCILFQKSIKHGKIPDYWKISYLVPVHKSGDKRNIKNYRPISILNYIAKIMESIISDELGDAFKHVIIEEQHGFRTGRSTLTNLLCYEHYLAEALEDKCQVDAIYTDFSKAFDTVIHALLILKLQQLGIDGELLLWITDYLIGRTQIVRVKSYFSRAIPVTSGVPQGSHLGPLMFTLFINDLALVIKQVNFLLYADDLKLYYKICTPEDCMLLQSDLNSVNEWCVLNGMHFNIQKCHVITFHRTISPIIFEYVLCGTFLASQDSVSDLGITFDKNLRFDLHIFNIVNKSLKMLGFIKRNTRDFTNIKVLKILYCSLVRSTLEYNSTIWSPYYKNMIEKVQTKFIQYARYKMHPNLVFSVTDVLNILDLISLHKRRVMCDLIVLFKEINGITDCIPLLNTINFHVPARQMRENDLFLQQTHRANYVCNAPVFRMIKMANEWHSDLDFFDLPLNMFLKQLHKLNIR